MEIKGILHAHSDYSYDAKLSLAELREVFVAEGLQFACMTEHTDELTPERARAFVVECDTLSDDVFRFIPGFEVPYKVNCEAREGALGYKVKKVNCEAREAGLGHCEAREGTLGCKVNEQTSGSDYCEFMSRFVLPWANRWTNDEASNHAHILMIGMRAFHDVYAPTIDILRRWTTESAFVVLAHPVRNLFSVDDGLLGEIDALEVWNQQYEGKRVPRVRSLKLLRELRVQKPGLIATGGVDLHRREHLGSPVVTLSADSLDEGDILSKLKTGAFTVHSEHAHFYGTFPDIDEKIRAYRFQSNVSVCIIVFGKFVNAVLATCGLSLPKSLKQYIRKSL